MDVVDDAEGPLDPRIQIELENLNSATDVINKLEIELDEAHTAFGQLWSESTRRLKDIANKLGASCIDRARCYYQALDVARQAQVQCQYQAQQFQRASEIHKAAKETEALAVAKFKSHQHEWNFDQAWQEMLNHATMKVMDAENQKAECGREHHRRATLFQDAEAKVQQLHEKYRRSIVKAESYFEIKAQYEQMLATQKERVEYLQKAVKDAKRAYSSSFRALEEISNQIHQQRRDYDMVANGPREPGVGAELISPEDSLSYEAEMNKVSISRVDSIASSSEPDTSDRSKDFDDVRELQQRVDQLGGRSIDGSESFSNQWELELQASMEKLNNLTQKEANWKKATRSIDSDVTDSRQIGGLLQSEKSLKNDQNEQHKKLPMEFQILKKFSSNSTTSGSPPGWQSLTHSPINSILSRSKIAIRNSLSKSLSNSPVNMSFAFGKSKIASSADKIDSSVGKIDNSVDKNDNPADKVAISVGNVATPSVTKSAAENDNRISNRDAISPENSSSSIVEKNRIEVDNRIGDGKIDEPSESKLPKEIIIKPIGGKSETAGRSDFSSRSVDSTPVRTKTILSPTEKSTDVKKIPCSTKKSTCRTSSVKELPLLSLFEAKSANASQMSRDKSCSLVNLAEKRNLKTLLDNSDLGNIQAVSVERLANARSGLMGERMDKK